jgi:tripartite-type tricarboxylate transporter receptor subunit TctC
LFRIFAVALAVLVIAPAAVLAASYPTRTVRLIVPYPPGGTTDMIARTYADKLSAELKQTVVVENKPGASTNIGTEFVARSNPDGYTLLFGASGSVTTTVFGPVPPFDPIKDFTPISMIADIPFVLAANTKAPFLTMRELLEEAKRKPGKYTVSSAQLNSYVELLKSRAGVNLLHIPYKGGAQSITDAISGQVDMVFTLLPVMLPHIEAHRLTPLAITSERRSPRLPQVPTLKELGVNYDSVSWFALEAPVGTPEPVVAFLNEVTQRVIADPGFVASLEHVGAMAVGSQPEALAARIAQQLASWREVAEQYPELVNIHK